MIIEFSGTPSSGKNSLIQYLKETEIHKVEVFEESNIADELDFDIQNHELRTLWRILDTYLRIIHTVKYSSTDPNTIFIVNRGFFDRIAWSRFLAYKNKYYERVAKDAESNLRKYLSQVDIIFLLISPFHKVKSRRLEQGLSSNEVFVNPGIINLLNKVYAEMFYEFSSETSIIKIDDTEQNISLESKIERVCQNLATRY